MKPFYLESALKGAVLNNTVTEADLKGEIADFPLHVVQAMCDEQVKQGNPFSPSVFCNDKLATRPKGGFTWTRSKRGHDFWHELISSRDFDLTPSPKAHPHAGLMMKYAEIAQTTDKPWEHFEVRRNKSAVWEAIYVPIPFYDNMEYRLKPEPPKTIRIGEYDVPEPVREPLENGTTCWYPKLSNIGLIDGYIWCNDDTDVRMLSYGLIHLTEEAAKAHAEALLSLTKAAD